ncbi:MAG: SGNH/GDSL hydrolase family protein [Pseudomonadota bacterium]
MKTFIRNILYVSCLSLMLGGCKIDDDSKISQIIVFGDSLSDGGTYQGLGLAKAGTLNGTTYSASGRFTTNPGKVWVEYLADHYHLPLTTNRSTGPGVGPNGSSGIVLKGGNNYAEGGAQITESPAFSSYLTDINGQLVDSAGSALTGYTITGSECVPTGTPVSNGITASSIKDQIDRYLVDNPQVPTDALVVVQGGSNDIIKQLYGISNCGNTYIPIAQAHIVETSTQLVQQINRLIDAGASKVLVGTLPDLSKTPFGAATSTEAQSLLNLMSQTINTALQNTVVSNNKVRLADFNGFYSNVISSPNIYGISVTTAGTACNLDAIYTSLAAYSQTPPNPALRSRSSVFCNEIDYVSSNAPLTYAFADSVHPTTTVHQQFANSVYTDLQNAGWK